MPDKELTIADVQELLAFQGVSKKTMEACAKKWLEGVSNGSHFPNRPVAEVSNFLKTLANEVDKDDKKWVLAAADAA